MCGKFLSPGVRRFDLIHHVDPVNPELAASTPLFRDPTNGGRIFTVDVREEIRALMCGIGRVGTLYGAHSMRIGGATALAFLGAAPEAITLRLMADGALMLICATYESASASACSIRAVFAVLMWMTMRQITSISRQGRSAIQT